MATVITLTPNVSSWSLGDTPIGVNVSGGDAGTGPDFLWESNNGTFVNKFAASTTFTPKNATKITTISGKRVYHSSFSGSANVTGYGAYGGLTKSGISSSWDAYGFLTPAITLLPSFYEVEILEANKEKAFGFLTNSTYIDPTIIDDDPNVTFTLAWHFLANGTAIPKAQGTQIATPVVYKAGDIFRISVDVGTVTYYMNGIIVATTLLPASDPLYPTMSFKTSGATFTSGSYMSNPANDGIVSLSVVGVLPIQANYSYELTNDNITNNSQGEDGGLYFRKRGRAKKALALNFQDKSFADYTLLNNFWQEHEKITHFLYKDLVANETYMMRFESGLQTSVESPDVITVQATLKEI